MNADTDDMTLPCFYPMGISKEFELGARPPLNSRKRESKTAASLSLDR
ncbi:hypothetical protein [Paraburkholderia sp. CNPSo 3281]|nr:hypothetical protein [Paraburkholderia sp. CNPSo 3281]MCP3718899.1 hypothetical protein [Paraburkholderia sp. CNPSo 3281]